MSKKRFGWQLPYLLIASLLIVLFACSELDDGVDPTPNPPGPEMPPGPDNPGRTVGEPVLVAYPAAPNAKESKRFAVKVNGKPVFVEEDRRISYVHFGFAGDVEVEVSVLGEDLESYTLSPTSFEIPSTAKGNKVSFKLERPHKLILHEINGAEADFVMEERLFIFANPLIKEAKDLGARQLVSATERGIDKTGAKDETAKVQSVIDDLSASGGGVMVFEPGLYKLTSLLMRDDVSVYLEGGARLQAANMPSSEDAFIKFLNVDNAKLLGPGSVDANGLYLQYQKGKQSSVLRADGASNCVVEDVILQDPGMFSVWIRDSENWSMYNVKLVDYGNKDLEDTGGEDGIDPDASRHVLIENSFIYAGDDATAIKAISPKWPVIEDITFRSNVIFNSALGAGLGIGSELENSHLKQITYENNDVVASRFAIAISMREFTSTPGDAPLIEDVYYRNNRFGTTRGSSIFRSDIVRNATLRNVTMEHLDFEGHKDGPYKNLPKLSTLGNGKIQNWRFDTVELYDEEISDESWFAEIGTGVSGLAFVNTTPSIVSVKADKTHIREDGSANFIISRTGNVTSDMQVAYSLRGTADKGLDYKDLSGSVRFVAGQKTAKIEVQPKSDTEQEGVESVLLTLSNTHNSPYMLGPTYQAMIALDDR